jgi:hypothetical protein
VTISVGFFMRKILGKKIFEFEVFCKGGEGRESTAFCLPIYDFKSHYLNRCIVVFFVVFFGISIA